MAATTFSCPECNKVLKSATPLPEGKKIKCPQCESVFAVSGSNGAASNGSTNGKKEKSTSAIRSKHDTPMPPSRRSKRDDDEDDEEVRRPAKRRAAVDDDDDMPAPKSKRKAARAADDYEDEVLEDEVIDDDEDEDDRPRKSKASKSSKSKKKQKGNGMLIGMILGGAGLALVGVFVLAAFVWPGFLRGSSLPAGNGQENLLAFMPAKCDVMFGTRDDANLKIDEIGRLLEQAVNLDPKSKGKFPPGMMQTMRDSEKIMGGGDMATNRSVIAMITKKPYDRDKMKKAFGAGNAVDLQGKVGYRIKVDGLDGCLAMPNNRLLLLGNLSDADFAAMMADGATPKLTGDIAGQVQRVQNGPLWVIVGLDGVRSQLQGLDAMTGFMPNGNEIKTMLKPVLSARLASVWVESVNQDSKIVAGLTCANANDAKSLKDQIKKFWDTQGQGLMGLLSVGLSQQSGNDAIKSLVNESAKTFSVQNDGALTSVSVQLSSKTMQDLVALAKKSMPQSGGMQGMPGGGMPGGGMQGMPGGMQGMPGGMQGMPGGMKGMPGGMQGMPGGMQGAPPGGFQGGKPGVPGGQPGFPGGNPGLPGGQPGGFQGGKPGAFPAPGGQPFPGGQPGAQPGIPGKPPVPFPGVQPGIPGGVNPGAIPGKPQPAPIPQKARANQDDFVAILEAKDSATGLRQSPKLVLCHKSLQEKFFCRQTVAVENVSTV